MKKLIFEFLADGQRATVEHIRAAGKIPGTRSTVSKCVSRMVKAGELTFVRAAGRIFYWIPQNTSAPAASAVGEANP